MAENLGGGRRTFVESYTVACRNMLNIVRHLRGTSSYFSSRKKELKKSKKPTRDSHQLGVDVVVIVVSNSNFWMMGPHLPDEDEEKKMKPSDVFAADYINLFRRLIHVIEGYSSSLKILADALVTIILLHFSRVIRTTVPEFCANLNHRVRQFAF